MDERMSDILCRNLDCPKRGQCKRAQNGPTDKWVYFNYIVTPAGIECNHFNPIAPIKPRGK